MAIELATRIYSDSNKSAFTVTLTEDVDFRVSSDVMKGADGAAWDSSAQQILTALKAENPELAEALESGRLPAGTRLNIPEIEGLTRAEWFETQEANLFTSWRNGGRLFGDARIEGTEGTDYRTVSTSDITGPELLELISHHHGRAHAIAAYNGISTDTLEDILNGETDITTAGTTIRIPLKDPFGDATYTYRTALPPAVTEVTTAPLENKIDTRDKTSEQQPASEPESAPIELTAENAVALADAARRFNEANGAPPGLGADNPELAALQEAARAAGLNDQIDVNQFQQIFQVAQGIAQNADERGEPGQMTADMFVRALREANGAALPEGVEVAVRTSFEREVPTRTVSEPVIQPTGDDELISFVNNGSYASAGVHNRGLSSNAVERMQATLVNGGFYAEGLTAETEVDGKYGSRTAAAVRALQNKYGLEADGVIGPDTLAALQIEEAQQALNAGQTLTAEQKTLLSSELADIAADSLALPAAVLDEARGLLAGIEAANLGEETEIQANLPAIQAKTGPQV